MLNEHYVHDSASFQIALAILLLVAVRLPRWRAPALIANSIQWGIHAISHLVDLHGADPAFVGYLDAILLPAGAAMLACLAVEALRQERGEVST